MKVYGQIPAGNEHLEQFLYPFHQNYPLKFWSKFRWLMNSKLAQFLPQLNEKKRWLTVIDRLGAPGDAIITANLIRCIKSVYPSLKINCITPNPILLKYDPKIDKINQKETFFSFDSSYWELIVRKEKTENIIAHNLKRLRIYKHAYKANFFLHDSEKKWAHDKLRISNKPIIAICTKSKERVKNWLQHYWIELIECLKSNFTIIHLGDSNEPHFNNVLRFAGKLNMRESAALLSKAILFIGPDSLLMHIANGLDISSVIIFGGSRPVECFGYAQNINLSSSPFCSPCWIHEGYEECSNSLNCLSQITVSQVLESIDSIIKTRLK